MNQDDGIIIICPHCEDSIYINKNEINCHIFRHGIYKNSYKQINPHLDKYNCDILKTRDLIYGCSKPFKLLLKNNKYLAEICDYI